jgi:hypothetical protein
MPKDMYFLKIIADVLSQPNPKETIRKAFNKITLIGRQPEYQQGFLQFQQFMSEVDKNWETLSTKPEDMVLGVVRELALQLAAGIFEGSRQEEQAIRDLIMSNPRWRDEFERLCLEASKSEAPLENLEIILERNQKCMDSISLEKIPAAKRVAHVKPGHFIVKLNTGRILWQGNLAEKDLLWAKAFPERDFELAADTGDADQPATKELRLLNDELIIRVFPGLESGRLEIKVREVKID